MRFALIFAIALASATMTLAVSAPAIAAQKKPKKAPAKAKAAEKKAAVKEKEKEPERAVEKPTEVPQIAPPGELRGPTRIDFDDRLIQGQTNKSGAVYLFDRKETGISSMVKRRKSFRQLTLSTIYDR